jgi:hypothetical protein
MSAIGWCTTVSMKSTVIAIFDRKFWKKVNLPDKLKLKDILHSVSLWACHT